MDTDDVARLQSLFGDRLPQRELLGTMKRLLACLALCASLSASAQDDNCTVLGVQELSSLYSELSASIDTIVAALQLTATSSSDTLVTEQRQPIIIDYKVCSHEACVASYINQGYVPLPGSPSFAMTWKGDDDNGQVQREWRQAMVKYADD